MNTVMIVAMDMAIGALPWHQKQKSSLDLIMVQLSNEPRRKGYGESGRNKAILEEYL